MIRKRKGSASRSTGPNSPIGGGFPNCSAFSFQKEIAISVSRASTVASKVLSDYRVISHYGLRLITRENHRDSRGARCVVIRLTGETAWRAASRVADPGLGRDRAA